MIIRPIEEKDIEQVVDIQIRSWQITYKGIIDGNYLNAMNYEEKVAQRKRDYHSDGFIVSELNNEIVGFCRYINNGSFSPEIKNIDCELLAIYVKPECKRTGIGTKMFTYVINDFRKQNKSKMIVWCLKENYSSRAFYEKMGGILVLEKNFIVGEKSYLEVGYQYNI